MCSTNFVAQSPSLTGLVFLTQFCHLVVSVAMFGDQVFNKCVF